MRPRGAVSACPEGGTPGTAQKLPTEVCRRKWQLGSARARTYGSVGGTTGRLEETGSAYEEIQGEGLMKKGGGEWEEAEVEAEVEVVV